MLAYREQNNLIHKLHPVTVLVFMGTVFTLALVFPHPLFLLALFLALAVVIKGAGIMAQWLVYLKFTVTMMVLLTLVNTVFSQAGSTVLFAGPRLPLIGPIEVSLEALAYGAGMGLRLLVVISVFCLYTYGVHPDKVMKLFSPLGGKSVLAITLTTRLFPLIAQDYKRITEIQRCRGVKFDTGSHREKLKNALPVISVLLLSSLERAMLLAESMHARGFASGPRTFYRHDFWRPRDGFILGTSLAGLALGLGALFFGVADYAYYPEMTRITWPALASALLLTGLLAFPGLLNWGWQKWPYFRSKI